MNSKSRLRSSSEKMSLAEVLRMSGILTFTSQTFSEVTKKSL